jgi:hypothetical protein
MNYGDSGYVEDKTTAQFESGEVAYLLHELTTPDEDGNIPQIWGQTIGTDKRPVLNGEKVYYGYATCTSTEISYSNSPLSDTQGHKYENGICDVCNEQIKYKFTLNNETCYFTYNMTWNDWLSSEFNTTNLVAVGYRILEINEEKLTCYQLTSATVSVQ